MAGVLECVVECPSCQKAHTMVMVYSLPEPFQADGSVMTHFYICPNTKEVVYLEMVDD